MSQCISFTKLIKLFKKFNHIASITVDLIIEMKVLSYRSKSYDSNKSLRKFDYIHSIFQGHSKRLHHINQISWSDY